MQRTRRQRMAALGRSQLKIMPRHEVDQAGAMAFSEILRKKPVYRDADTNAYVLCITRELTGRRVDCVVAAHGGTLRAQASGIPVDAPLGSNAHG